MEDQSNDDETPSLPDTDDTSPANARALERLAAVLELASVLLSDSHPTQATAMAVLAWILKVISDFEDQ